MPATDRPSASYADPALILEGLHGLGDEPVDQAGGRRSTPLGRSQGADQRLGRRPGEMGRRGAERVASRRQGPG